LSAEIVRVGATVDRLGEGLLWDDRRGLLYWCDAMEGRIHRLDPVDGAHSEVSTGKMIGAIALRQSGGAVAALDDGFYFLDLETGRSAPIATFDLGRDDIRFNDGKVDRQGRFIAGGMHIRPPKDGVYVGAMYRLGGDLVATQLEAGIGNCNGPCFSPDGATFYFSDSPRRLIYAYDYDPAGGALANRRIFADTHPFDSPPDGATVDSDGFLWSAMVTGGKIVRFDPKGKAERIIETPFRHPTDVAFGGPALDILYVTSISRSPNISASESEAGGLFAIHGLGMKGLAEPRFVG
jgi:sugar lactone lactonase YvrE